jgi:hypothetical protein
MKEQAIDTIAFYAKRLADYNTENFFEEMPLDMTPARAREIAELLWEEFSEAARGYWKDIAAGIHTPPAGLWWDGEDASWQQPPGPQPECFAPIGSDFETCQDPACPFRDVCAFDYFDHMDIGSRWHRAMDKIGMRSVTPEELEVLFEDSTLE